MAVFINPYLQKNSRFKQVCGFSYLTNVEDYKYIAPKCLLVPGAKGTNHGVAERAPKYTVEDNKYDILNIETAQWPVRINRWGNNDFGVQNKPEYFSEFHIYDAVEYSEDFDTNNRYHSRFSSLVYPSGTVITLFGLSKSGQRIAVHVFGTMPYFYVDKAAMDTYYNITTCDGVRRVLTKLLRESPRWGDKTATEQVFSVTVEKKRNIYFYDTEEVDYYVVKVKNCKYMGFINENFPSCIPKFEGRVDSFTRFLLDNNFKSFGWYKFKENSKLQLRDKESCVTSCEIEINCTSEDLEILDNNQWPDYKLMCFDIECKAGGLNEFAFPDANNNCDVVIQISCVLCSLLTHEVENRILFSLGSCKMTEEALVIECDSEYELILSFMTFFKQYSPEYITGYNINNFDLPYLLTKASTIYGIKLDGYGKMNRRGIFKVIDMSHNKFQKSVKVKLNGVISLDMYPIIKGKLSLSNYKLNTVCAEILKEQKNDLSYKDIPVFFAEGAEKRGIIGDYCLQDSLLVVKLFFKYLPNLEISEIAKLAYIGTNRVITDGQQIRVFVCLLNTAKKYNYILPDRKFGEKNESCCFSLPESVDGSQDEGDEGESAASQETLVSNNSYKKQIGYQGATVLEPESGFYVDPVVVFDFASLYPSIIQAHNLCLCTLTTNKQSLSNLEENVDYAHFNVQGHDLYYVKPHIRQSLLGELLTDWLALRKHIRSKMKDAPPEEQMLLEKQQLAIKVTCNSVYGFTGVGAGLLPCLEVAATVTMVGRNMLLATKDYIHERWHSKENLLAEIPQLGPHIIDTESFSMKTIYGDTDSVFIKCTGITLQGLNDHGDDIAKHISVALFTPPIKLECEKTFTKLLMITKKKYIGIINGQKMMMKGIDLVRKNNCLFVNRNAKALVDCLFFNDGVSEAAAILAKAGLTDINSTLPPSGFMPFGQILKNAYLYISQSDLNIKDFILSAELSRAPENYVNTKIPHLTVYNKLKERNEQLPKVKDRIEFVMIEEGAVLREMQRKEADSTGSVSKPKRVLISDLAEDPLYVIKHNIPLNTEYYFSRLLGMVSVTFQALFKNNVKYTESFLRTFIPETAVCSKKLHNTIRNCNVAVSTVKGAPVRGPLDSIFEKMRERNRLRIAAAKKDNEEPTPAPKKRKNENIDQFLIPMKRLTGSGMIKFVE